MNEATTERDTLYAGEQTPSRDWIATRDGVPFDPAPSQAVWNHSPTGFAWGYQGSGPAQLALALLLDAGVDRERAVGLHQQFKRQIVATWPQDGGWQIRRSAILEWVWR